VAEDSDVVGTGIIVMISPPEAELELRMVSVVFEKGTPRGRLNMSAYLGLEHLAASYCLPFPSRRTSPAELRAASKRAPETIWDPIIFPALPELTT
jgi:hypothetical protein